MQIPRARPTGSRDRRRLVEQDCAQDCCDRYATPCRRSPDSNNMSLVLPVHHITLRLFVRRLPKNPIHRRCEWSDVQRTSAQRELRRRQRRRTPLLTSLLKHRSTATLAVNRESTPSRRLQPSLDLDHASSRCCRLECLVAVAAFKQWRRPIFIWC